MTNIQQLQQVDLEIAKAVVQICEKHELTYYMLGGTMLGAVRHQGFIPWDDDIDLGLPRDDYERFLQIAQAELPETYRVVNYRNTPSFQYYITRVVDTDTKVIEERIGNDNMYTHASIDLFPIDGTPNNRLLRNVYYFRVLFHRAMMALCYKDSIDRQRPRSFPEQVLLFIMERLPVEKFTNPAREKEAIDRLLRKHSVGGSRYIGNIMGAYRTREIVPAEYYGQGKFYRFEDTELRGLERADEYLRYTYGDYRKLPPPEKRKTHYRVLEIHGQTAEEFEK